MPEKKTDLARIRNNQRRSRARRNEYLHDLEERLREHELRGVQASSSLQTAARGVMRENARLRSLLTRKGIMDAEIESYLRVDTHAPDWGASDALSARIILPSSTRSSHDQEDLTKSSSNTSHQEIIGPSSPKFVSTVQPHESAGVLNASEDADCHQLSTCPITNRDQLIESQRSPSQEHTERLNSSTKHLEEGKGIQNNMTPCMEAAMIIASMNSGLSIEEANAELGCPAVNDCYVDNLTVFRVMDR